jgi:hypothetical protein
VPNGESLRFDVLDNVMIVVHADMPPDDEDWRRLVVVRGNRAHLRGTLVLAPPRASINAAQRADVAAYMRASNASIAVVTDSALVRGLAGAVRLLGVKVRAFTSREIAAALAYLAVAPSRHAEFLHHIDVMRSQLGSVD